MPPVTKILIVDDHPVVRAGLVAALSRDESLAICGEAETVAEALKAVAKQNPDLVLADLDLEDSSGLDLIKKIRETAPKIRVLVLSMHDEDLYAERALRAGAFGYVMKQQSPEHLASAIRNVMEGRIAVSEKIASRVLRHLVGRPGETNPSPIDSLTDRELEIFRILGHGAGTRRVAEKLKVSIKTVEAHIAHIKQKLGISTGTELQHRAFQWSGAGGGPEKPQSD